MWWIAIISIVVSLAGSIYGIKKGLIAAWVLMFNVIFSSYFAIRFVVILGKYSPTSLPNQWAKSSALLLSAVLIFIVLQALAKHLFPGANSLDFPKYFEMIASPLFSFLGSYMAFWFIIYVFLVTPIGNADAVRLNMGENLLMKAREKVCTSFSIIRVFSLQEYDCDGYLIYEWIENNPEKLIPIE